LSLEEAAHRIKGTSPKLEVGRYPGAVNSDGVGRRAVTG
jgi:hypothetical protein